MILLQVESKQRLVLSPSLGATFSIAVGSLT